MRPVGEVRPRLTVRRPPALVRRARVPGIPVLCPPECEEPDVFSETSLGEELGKYNSLIQAQARELSHLRQLLREGRGVSRSLAQHLRDALRSFEDLLRGTDIDYYLGQGFREQLAQGRQLAERLSDKLGISNLEVKLQERSESPGSSCPPSESSHSASSSSFTSEGLEPCSDGDAASEYSQCHKEPAQHTGTVLQYSNSNSSASGHRDLASWGVPGSPEPQGPSVRLSQSQCNTSFHLSPVSRPSL
uniref:Uncharacterized protein n=1 Tax=Catharus ustulatus TaxID=91951 RepID=A0A8C3XZP6_CATUS